MPKYDYLVVGAGLFGSVFAHEAIKRGKTVLVVEKRNHIGGNCYTETQDGLHIHKYGIHVFHTAHKPLFDYINQFAEFNNFSLHGRANYKNRIYSMPINLFTLQDVWGVSTPDEAERKLNEVRIPCENARNLEEHILSMVGREIYEMFIQGYTAKQWGRDPSELPKSIIQRLPIRLSFSDRWFKDEDRWEGMPIGGYTPIFEKMLKGSEVQLGTCFFDDRHILQNIADKIVFTGPIDAYYDNRFGNLEYRSLNFQEEKYEADFQGTAMVTFTEKEVPWTRIIEHKYCDFNFENKSTIITREFPAEYTGHNTPFYPLRTDKNSQLYNKYLEFSKTENVIFGGRLARYQYFNMDQTIANALSVVRTEFS